MHHLVTVPQHRTSCATYEPFEGKMMNTWKNFISDLGKIELLRLARKEAVDEWGVDIPKTLRYTSPNTGMSVETFASKTKGGAPKTMLKPAAGTDYWNRQ
jgi:hypothetical protein